MSDSIYHRFAALTLGVYLGGSLIGSMADMQQAERVAAPFIQRDFNASLQQIAINHSLEMAAWIPRQQKILEGFAAGPNLWVKDAADHEAHLARQALLDHANKRNMLMLPGPAGCHSALVVASGRSVIMVDPGLSDDQIKSDLFSLLAYAAKYDPLAGIFDLSADRKWIGPHAPNSEPGTPRPGPQRPTPGYNVI